MQKSTKGSVVVPIAMITLGVGWLLTAQQFAPGINWVWTLGLGVVGVLAFALNGIDKLSVVVGPFFLLASVLSVLRQMDSLPVNVEVPLLVIAFGVLLLVARLPVIPTPEWLIEPEPRRAREGSGQLS